MQVFNRCLSGVSGITNKSASACVKGFGGLLLLAVVTLAGCSGGPPTETMRKIGESRAGLSPLTPEGSKGARAIARTALLLDPDVREQASLNEASIDQIAIERSALMPSLGFGVVGGVGDAGAGDPNLELSGKQLLLDFGGTKRAVEAADVDLQIQYQTFQTVVDRSVATALETYRHVAMLEEMVVIRQAQLQTMRELYQLINERIEIGASTTPDLLETRNRMERTEFELLEAKLELSEVRDKLQRLTGYSNGGEIPNFSQNCAPPGGETDELRIARLELVKSRLNLETAKRARLPRISLNPLGRARIGGGAITTGMNVSVDSPLFDGGAITARQNAARNRQNSAEALVEAEERNLRLDDLRLRRQLSSLKEKQAMLARQIKIVSETRDLYRSQYIELGTREITDVLDAEEDVFSRRAELNTVNFELQARLIECAARSKSLRKDLGLTQFHIYGYPLTVDGF